MSALGSQMLRFIRPQIISVLLPSLWLWTAIVSLVPYTGASIPWALIGMMLFSPELGSLAVPTVTPAALFSRAVYQDATRQITTLTGILHSLGYALAQKALQTQVISCKTVKPFQKSDCAPGAGQRKEVANVH